MKQEIVCRPRLNIEYGKALGEARRRIAEILDRKTKKLNIYQKHGLIGQLRFLYRRRRMIEKLATAYVRKRGQFEGPYLLRMKNFSS